jgi:hypothetical protein
LLKIRIAKINDFDFISNRKFLLKVQGALRSQEVYNKKHLTRTSKKTSTKHPQNQTESNQGKPPKHHPKDPQNST